MEENILKRWAKKEQCVAIHEETLAFTINGKWHEFEIYHNLHFYNLDIYLALEEWAKITKIHTALSFCGFIMSEKADNLKLVCVPKKEWMEFQKKSDEDSAFYSKN